MEVVFAAFALGVTALALCGCISSGFSLIQAARENLRATQIMVQRTEAIRLFNWNQVLDTNYLKPSFTENYDPQSASANAGPTYQGFITASVPNDVPTAYRTNMRTISISVYWTNYNGRQVITHNRQLKTQVSRYGLQNYVYGGHR